MDVIDYLRTRALVAAIVDKDKAQEALDNFRDNRIPYYKASKQRDKEHHIKRLMGEVGRGALSIKPVAGFGNPVRSKLRTKYIDASRRYRSWKGY